MFITFALATWLACSDDAAVTNNPGGIPSGNPNGANDGAGCAQGSDCKSGICTGGHCAVGTSTDHVRNNGETGLDCGGPSAPPCGNGQPCNVGSDCASTECAGGLCAEAPPPTATDGKKNGDESDVDCGGTTTNAPRCVDGRACNAGEDCESKVCSAEKTCAVPSATDQVKNGDETDVDCGGTTTNAPRCATGKACVKHADCESDGCGEDNKCALTRSCAPTNGGTTCGIGEVGDPQAQHESCCVSLPIPGRATKLDKYKVTAGRMRAFITRVNGDVKGWYAANRATLTPGAQAQLDPFAGNDYLPTDLNSAAVHLGGFIFLTDRPSVSQGCYVGTVAEGANGSHTYWNDIEGDDRGFDKAHLDRLTLNCVPLPLAAAFCAWDGGRLQTYDENNAAYGAGPYPWGANPLPGGYNDNGVVVGPAASSPPGACPTCDPSAMNWLASYQNPPGGNAAKPHDFAFLISPPGRFAIDTGAGGHKDLGGIMMELTYSQGPNDPKYGTSFRWSRAGSFEGHAANVTAWNFPTMTKYGKVSARCARD